MRTMKHLPQILAGVLWGAAIGGLCSLSLSALIEIAFLLGASWQLIFVSGGAALGGYLAWKD